MHCLEASGCPSVCIKYRTAVKTPMPSAGCRRCPSLGKEVRHPHARGGARQRRGDWQSALLSASTDNVTAQSLEGGTGIPNAQHRWQATKVNCIGFATVSIGSTFSSPPGYHRISITNCWSIVSISTASVSNGVFIIPLPLIRRIVIIAQLSPSSRPCCVA